MLHDRFSILAMKKQRLWSYVPLRNSEIWLLRPRRGSMFLKVSFNFWTHWVVRESLALVNTPK